MTHMRRPTVVGTVALAALAAGAVITVRILRHGFSARDEPTVIEGALARLMRRYATPADLRGRRNPLQVTPAILGSS